MGSITQTSVSGYIYQHHMRARSISFPFFVLLVGAAPTNGPPRTRFWFYLNNKRTTTSTHTPPSTISSLSLAAYDACTHRTDRQTNAPASDCQKSVGTHGNLCPPTLAATASRFSPWFCVSNCGVICLHADRLDWNFIVIYRACATQRSAYQGGENLKLSGKGRFVEFLLS